MYSIYLSALREQVRQAKAVKKHPSLRGPKWTIKGFELLSDLIAQSLQQNLTHQQQRETGTTISAKTLFNIFKDDYKPGYPLDPRTVNSLSKLCIFIGYGSWYDFMEAADEMTSANEDDLQSKLSVKGIKQISRYMVSVLDELRCGNDDTRSAMLAYQSEHTTNTCLHPVVNLVLEYSSPDRTVDNPFNPSEAEIREYDVVEASDNHVLIRATERWLLCWFDMNIKKYVKRWDKTMTLEYVCQLDADNKIKVETCKFIGFSSAAR